MAFTASSRSRNSGDPKYHFKIAVTSNGIWFLCHILVWKQIWESVSTGNWWMLAITGLVYVVCTSAGSSYMMKIMLKKESGNKRVGAAIRNQSHKARQKPMSHLQIMDEVCCGAKPKDILEDD